MTRRELQHQVRGLLACRSEACLLYWHALAVAVARIVSRSQPHQLCVVVLPASDVAIPYLVCRSVFPSLCRLVVCYDQRTHALSRYVALCIFVPLLQQQYRHCKVLPLDGGLAAEACEAYAVRRAGYGNLVVVAQCLRTSREWYSPVQSLWPFLRACYRFLHVAKV